MLSRVADSIYWMSRYSERAENVARFIEVNLKLMLDDPSGEGQQWEPLVSTTGVQKALRRGHATKCHSFPHLRCRKPQLDSILRPLRARKRPHHPRNHFIRN